MQNAQELAARIEQLAKEQGLTVSKLLSDCGLAAGLVGDMKGRGSIPSADRVFRIAQYLGVTMEFLLTGEDRPQNRKGDYAMHKTGEKPGKGVYICTKCGQRVVLDDTTDTLPPCPSCSGTFFKKA